MAQTVACYCNI